MADVVAIRARQQADLVRESNAILEDEVQLLPVPDPPKTRWQAIHRSAAFQIMMVSVLAFSGPGMSEAITALGGGGLAAPWAANAATSVSYVMVALVSAFGGPICSRLGIRWMLIIGAATFPVNGSAYYVSNVYRIDWYLILGRALYGLGFGLWYVAEAAIILSYPEEGRRGRYLAIWVGSRNMGSLVGGFISLGRNVSNPNAGSISATTYLIFIAIEAVGFPISWLISSPQNVRRADGVPIMLAAKRPVRVEMKVLYRAFIRPRMLLLAPIGFYSFFYGGVAYTYLANFFSVRARTLSSVIQPAAIIVTTALYGRFILDSKVMNQHRRAQVGFWVWVIPTLACFGWMVRNQVVYSAMSPNPKYDWADSHWAAAYMPFWIIQIVGLWGQSYVYWLLSCFATDVVSNARNGGIFRFVEACGQAISYGINSNSKVGVGPMAFNLALTCFMIPFTCVVIAQVPIYRADDLRRPGAQEGQGVTDEEVGGAKDVTDTTVVELQAR